MNISHIRRILFSVILVISGTGLAADEGKLRQAQIFLDNGRLTEAELVYQKVLLEEPLNSTANFGLATINAFRGNYSRAILRYKYVLDQEPENLQALVGLGYVLAWSGQLGQAQETFEQAAKIAPENFDVKKGQAFIALWREDAADAVSAFEKLVSDYPDDTELQVALGQAYLLNRDSEGAVESFEAVLQREPENRAAQGGFRAAHALPSVLEIDVLYGNNDDDTGLRQLEVGSWVNRQTRIWLRYDDSLSLDVPDLTRGDAENILVGVFHEFDNQWLGKFEIGKRDLPMDQDQDIYAVEVVHLLERKNFKLGYQSAPHSEDYTDRLLYGSVGFAAGDRWYIEPTLYLSESGAIEDESTRLLTRFAYQSEGLWSVELGLGFGETKSDLEEAEGDITIANFNWYMPLTTSLRLSLLFGHEDNPSGDTSSAIVGINWRLQ